MSTFQEMAHAKMQADLAAQNDSGLRWPREYVSGKAFCEEQRVLLDQAIADQKAAQEDRSRSDEWKKAEKAKIAKRVEAALAKLDTQWAAKLDRFEGAVADQLRGAPMTTNDRIAYEAARANALVELDLRFSAGSSHEELLAELNNVALRDNPGELTAWLDGLPLHLRAEAQQARRAGGNRVGDRSVEIKTRVAELAEERETEATKLGRENREWIDQQRELIAMYQGPRRDQLNRLDPDGVLRRMQASSAAAAAE